MILKSPRYGNTKVLDTGVLTRHNLGGDLLTAYDPTWPIIERTRMEFEGLSKKAKDEFITFLVENQAEIIQFEDFEKNIWEGVISGDTVEVINRHGKNCDFLVSFEFEGTMIL